MWLVQTVLGTSKYPTDQRLSSSMVTGPITSLQSNQWNQQWRARLHMHLHFGVSRLTRIDAVNWAGSPNGLFFSLPIWSPFLDTWLNIPSLRQSSKASISCLDSCPGLRPHRSNDIFYISRYMCNRHLKRNMARAELKAVEQCLGASFVSLFPTHASPWPTYEQILMTLTSNISWPYLSPSLLMQPHFQITSLMSARAPLLAFISTLAPADWSLHSSRSAQIGNQITSPPAGNTSVASSCTSSTIYIPNLSLKAVHNPALSISSASSFRPFRSHCQTVTSADRRSLISHSEEATPITLLYHFHSLKHTYHFPYTHTCHNYKVCLQWYLKCQDT